MTGARLHCLVERVLPQLGSLVGQAGDEVQAPVGDADFVDCFDGGVDVCEAVRAATGFQEVVLEALKGKESFIRKDKEDVTRGRCAAFDVRIKFVKH